MLYSSSVYSRAYAYAYYARYAALFYARIHVIVVCCETRYVTPCKQPSSTKDAASIDVTLLYCRAVCGGHTLSS